MTCVSNDQAHRILIHMVERNGYPPTVTEFARELGRAKTAAYHHLCSMAARGLIERKPRSPRGIKLLRWGE